MLSPLFFFCSNRMGSSLSEGIFCKHLILFVCKFMLFFSYFHMLINCNNEEPITICILRVFLSFSASVSKKNNK